MHAGHEGADHAAGAGSHACLCLLQHEGPSATEEEPSADNFKELFKWLDSTEETATSAVEAAEADQRATAATEELVNVENI